MAEAKKRISEIDIEAYAKKAKRYVKNKDLSKKANDEMRYYNAANEDQSIRAVES